jgi:hypothetical protein
LLKQHPDSLKKFKTNGCFISLDKELTGFACKTQFLITDTKEMIHTTAINETADNVLSYKNVIVFNSKNKLIISWILKNGNERKASQIILNQNTKILNVGINRISMKN